MLTGVTKDDVGEGGNSVLRIIVRFQNAQRIGIFRDGVGVLRKIVDRVKNFSSLK